MAAHMMNICAKFYSNPGDVTSREIGVSGQQTDRWTDDSDTPCCLPAISLQQGKIAYMDLFCAESSILGFWFILSSV